VARSEKGRRTKGTAEESPPAGRVTDETDYFRLADHSGVDTIFVNTSAFTGTYLVELPTTGLSRPNRTSSHPLALRRGLGCIRMPGLLPLGMLGKLERRLQHNIAPGAKVVGRDVNRDIRSDADAFEL